MQSEQLLIGTTMQIERQGGGSVSQVYSVSLIGYVTGQGLILALNDKRQSVADFRPGEGFVLRLSLNGQVNAYETSILSVAFQPYPHLHLRFPEQMGPMTQRRSPRYPVDLPILRLTIREGIKDYEVTMSDISAQGACLVCNQPLGREGEFFSIDIPVPGSTDLISLPCHLRYVRSEQASQEKQYYHGVEFGELDDDAQIFLSGYIEELAQHMHFQD